MNTALVTGHPRPPLRNNHRHSSRPHTIHLSPPTRPPPALSSKHELILTGRILYFLLKHSAFLLLCLNSNCILVIDFQSIVLRKCCTQILCLVFCVFCAGVGGGWQLGNHRYRTQKPGLQLSPHIVTGQWRPPEGGQWSPHRMHSPPPPLGQQS